MSKQLILGPLLAVLLQVPAAIAGSVNGAYITTIFTTSSDGAFVYFDRNVTEVASCGATNPNRLAIKPSTPGGKAQLAAAMLAFSQQRPVNATGNKAASRITSDKYCDVWGDTESLLYLW